LNFLIDTNVISEARKPQPDPNVVRWILKHEGQLFLSVITVAELRFGVERLASSEHRHRLEAWVHRVVEGFGDRVLPVDKDVAQTWGSVMAKSEQAGRRMAPVDCFVAATALVWDLTLATRDVTGFAGFNGRLMNPWEA
jgi:toxin FitB